MYADKKAVQLGEQVDITIVAELLDISPALLFFLPGSNAYRLKLLVPSGFEQTDGNFVDYVGDNLSYPSKSFAIYHLRGRFSSITEGGCFRLLRGDGEATEQSLFIEKASICIKATPIDQAAINKAPASGFQPNNTILYVTPDNVTKSARVASPDYRSNLEFANCTSIGGWALDRNALQQSINLDIYLNDTKVATILANQSRDDVAKAYGSSSFQSFGFRWDIPEKYRTNAPLKVSVKFPGTSTDIIQSPINTPTCAATTTTTPPTTTPPTTTTTTPPTTTPPTTTTTTPPTTTTTTPPVTTTTAPPVTPSPSASYRSSVDFVNCEALGGWVFDANATTRSVSVDVYINGTKVATVLADQQRQDVANAYGIGNYNRYGFYWSIPASYKANAALKVSLKAAGTTVELNNSPLTTAVCAGTGQPPTTTPPTTTTTTPPTTTPPTTTPPTTTTTAPPVTPSPNASYRSSVDFVNCEALGGWVFDANATTQSVSVDVYINGTKVATVLADQQRQDVANAYGIGNYNRYGFYWSIPASYKANAALKVSLKAAGTTVELNNSPLTTAVCAGTGQPPTTPPTTTPPTTTTTTPTPTPNPSTPPSGDYPILSSSQPADQRPSIQNERVRVAIDLGVGGVIREVTDLQVGENMINCLVKSDGKRDTGRDDQISLYSLPDANTQWTTGGSALHDDIGYNPVQGGDIMNNRGHILGYGKTNNMLYCKSRGLHWGLNNVPGDYVVEQWIRLEGNIVRRHIRITGDRPDNTRYDNARQQELPCTYTSGSYYQYYVVQGTPYTNAPLVNVNSIPNFNGPGKTLNDYHGGFQVSPLDIDASEPWIAAVRPSDNRGLALHTPFSHEFKVGLFNEVGAGPPESYNAGYIACSPTMILDRNGVYEFDINMVVGTLNEIRSTVNNLSRSETKPNYVFAGQGKRHGFYYRSGYDQGYPVGDELAITPTDRRFRIITPRKGYKAADFNTVYIRMRAQTPETQMVLAWRKVGQSELSSLQAGQQMTFPVQGDNQYRTIAIPVGNHPTWNGTINELIIKYITPNGDTNGQQIGVKWISSDNLGN